MTTAWGDRLLFLSPVAVVGALTVVSAFEDGPTFCPFALSTGVACPGCGMTRAASRLLRGDFASAVSFHPLVPAVALVAVGGWVWFVLRRSGRVPTMSNSVLNGILITLSVALLAVWIARLATGTLPPV